MRRQALLLRLPAVAAAPAARDVAASQHCSEWLTRASAAHVLAFEQTAEDTGSVQDGSTQYAHASLCQTLETHLCS
jgi:hypothetical protein